MPTMSDITAHLQKIDQYNGWPIWTAFILLLLGVLFFFSRANGWHELHRHYPARNAYQGEWIGHDLDEMHVQFNHAEGVNAIRVGADPAGLHISVWIGFRPFHPPIFIPWSEVTAVGVKEVPWLKKDNLVKFTFAMNPAIPVYLGTDAAREAERLSQGQWRLPALN